MLDINQADRGGGRRGSDERGRYPEVHEGSGEVLGKAKSCYFEAAEQPPALRIKKIPSGCAVIEFRKKQDMAS
jgi:hypothetical protein